MSSRRFSVVALLCAVVALASGQSASPQSTAVGNPYLVTGPYFGFPDAFPLEPKSFNTSVLAAAPDATSFACQSAGGQTFVAVTGPSTLGLHSTQANVA